MGADHLECVCDCVWGSMKALYCFWWVTQSLVTPSHTAHAAGMSLAWPHHSCFPFHPPHLPLPPPPPPLLQMVQNSTVLLNEMLAGVPVQDPGQVRGGGLPAGQPGREGAPYAALPQHPAVLPEPASSVHPRASPCQLSAASPHTPTVPAIQW